MIMNVEIGEGRTGEIVVHECDEPDDLARNFCEKYGLSPRIFTVLTSQIEANIEQLVEDQCNYVDESPKKVRPRYNSPGKKQPTASFGRRFNGHQIQMKQPSFGGSQTERLNCSSSQRSNLDLYGALPGHRLYEKGMLMKKAVQEATRKKLKEKEELESVQLTFAPAILKRISTEPKLAEVVGHTITNRLKNKEMKLKKMRDDIDIQRMSDCTFKPDISEGSRELMKNRAATASERLDQLFKEAKEIEEKRKYAEQQLIKSTCPFKPEIISTPTKAPKTASNSPFRPRRTETPLKSQMKMVDSECSFKPKTGRPPKFNRNSEELPIGQYLNAQKSRRESPNHLSAKPSQFACENSLKIIDKLRFTRYEQIFRAFCRHGTNEAVWDISQTAALETKLAKVISPFIEELAKSTEIYDLPKFCEALEQYAKKLSPLEKSTLCSTAKAPPVPDQMPFKPKITGNYSTSNLKSRTKEKLYDRLLKDQQKSRSKLNEKKIRKIEEEMYECTFYPNTLEHRNLSRRKPVEPEQKPSI